MPEHKDRTARDEEKDLRREQRRAKLRPQGRRMPHPHEAKNDDGTIDVEEAKAGAAAAIASFESGEYILKDMNEGQVTQQNVAQLNKICGVSASVGDEFYIAIRKKA